ncbi:MAG: hypothetical protein PVI31_11820, partial [Gemmatimonadota bacterium]
LMTIRAWTTGKRILSAWILIATVAAIGWIAGSVYADLSVRGLDREQVCRNTGVALGDTVLRGIERARRDSAELADRNCAARYALARQGRESSVRIRVGIVVLLSVLVAGVFTLSWAVRRAWGRLRR